MDSYDFAEDAGPSFSKKVVIRKAEMMAEEPEEPEDVFDSDVWGDPPLEDEQAQFLTTCRPAPPAGPIRDVLKKVVCGAFSWVPGWQPSTFPVSPPFVCACLCSPSPARTPFSSSSTWCPKACSTSPSSWTSAVASCATCSGAGEKGSPCLHTPLVSMCAAWLTSVVVGTQKHDQPKIAFSILASKNIAPETRRQIGNLYSAVASP